MKRIRRSMLCLLTALWLFHPALAQDYGFMVGAGVASSRMDDMKYYQELLAGNYPVQGKVVASFPVYTTASIGVLKQLWPTVRAGAGYIYTTTGGKINYTDYSGSMNTDMLGTSHRIGAWISYQFLSRERYDLSLYGRADANISRMNITTSVYALGYTDALTNTYKATSPAGTAGLEFFFHLRQFSLGLDGGYMVEKPGKLSNREDNSELNDPYDPGRNLTTDWTGWRAQVKVIVWMGD